MKIILDFEEKEGQSQIPFEAKLTLIRRIMKAAHNPNEFVTLELKPFTMSDK